VDVLLFSSYAIAAGGTVQLDLKTLLYGDDGDGCWTVLTRSV
jgi:hypothetical protein